MVQAERMLFDAKKEVENIEYKFFVWGFVFENKTGEQTFIGLLFMEPY